MSEKTIGKEMLEKLAYKKKNVFEESDAEKIKAIYAYSDGYMEYIDFRTLGLLFCLMAVMAGLNNLGVFKFIAEKMLSKVKNITGISIILLCGSSISLKNISRLRL